MKNIFDNDTRLIIKDRLGKSNIYHNNAYVNPDEGYDALRDVYDYLIYDSNDELIYTLLEEA